MIVHELDQGSIEWHELRGPIPTGSEFSRVITSTGKESTSLKDYAIELAANKYAGICMDGFSGNKFTKRGTVLEDHAIADYEMVNQVEVDHVGFITNNLMTYGVSPDGLIGKDGGAEVKCKTAKEHIKAMMYIDETGMIPTEYLPQVQGCLLVTKRKWWDFILYHPNIPGKTLRVYPDKEFHKALRKQLKAVIFERDNVIKYLNALKEVK